MALIPTKKPAAPVAPAAPDPAVEQMAALLVETLPFLGHTISAVALRERIQAFIGSTK